MKKLITQIRSFAGLITAISVIAGATMFVNSRTERNRGSEQSESFTRVLDTLAVMQEDIRYINIEQSMMSEQIQGIQDTLDDFEEEHKAQGEQIKSLAWGLRNIEQFTPVQFEEIMNQMLNKEPPAYSGGFEATPID